MSKLKVHAKKNTRLWNAIGTLVIVGLLIRFLIG